ncbi:hypothetical protein QP027_07315 [Corynebacterium breve]|uniref:Uncharacterized protein n=1 Tax=Corynebacterium breve TaxID=3049799 RepID=A0ABY8VC93_9CORY|nr:hypothetical protein [Corynebacterium breve]WIM66942.1 hypothetical protein QP027_07315 [Corynebacterium breve]
MTTLAVSSRPAVAPSLPLLPPLRLHLEHNRKTSNSPPWGKSAGFQEPVRIMLSKHLSCVFRTASGQLFSQSDLGTYQLTAHQLWRLAATEIIAGHLIGGETELLVRCSSVLLGRATPPGIEVSSAHASGASWLGHPRTFTILHHHCVQLLQPKIGLVYSWIVMRERQRLFVFDAHPEAIRSVPGLGEPVEYAHGFPVLR